MRVLELLRKTIRSLEEAGIDDALSDAEMLVFHAAGLERLAAYVNNPETGRLISARVSRLLQRRLKGEPVQYIIGQVEFAGLAVKVGKGVLIPRPETELLVEEAVKAVRSKKPEAGSQPDRPVVPDSSSSACHLPLSFLDLCTGSGCIALALAKEFTGAKVYGTDISGKALAFAKRNAADNGLQNVTFIQGPLFGPVKGMTFDLIISNPPYIRREELDTLQQEIRDWEPVEALDGGEDGMDFYRAILLSAGEYLKAGGLIFFELGYGQAEEVLKFAKRQGFKDISVITDYAGIKRILKAEK
jgi:release factor glutamine methyltransferase